MTDPLAAAEARLVEVLAAEARGPRRNGLFAVWLFTRTAGGLLPPDRLGPRQHQRRLVELERRLSSVSVAAPLRRALLGGLEELGAGTTASAAAGLRLLVAPVRETLGPAAADAVVLAARDARAAAHTELSA